MTSNTDRRPAEERFREVFAHLGAVTAYARRRGSRDADGIAAEAMSIAWRRLADVPRDDPLPWLYATARNLLLAERRAASRTAAVGSEPPAPAPELQELDPPLDRALRSLGPADREALLLVAWEDLAPTQAAHALGLNPTAFRVRLLRARRRLRAALEEERRPAPLVRIDVEGT
ncbi:MAG TPA: sigma factor-like helix-turn-helix DNA-binding protein [Gaiellaceae bacterium]|nr:sigma factor-like helix-turn-helix DNA-binding protein [Gaiellaceae bacterium]